MTDKERLTEMAVVLIREFGGDKKILGMIDPLQETRKLIQKKITEERAKQIIGWLHENTKP